MGYWNEIQWAVDEAQCYGDALLAIVGRPWGEVDCGCCAECPYCGAINTYRPDSHCDDCAWLIAARALGIA